MSDDHDPNLTPPDLQRLDYAPPGLRIQVAREEGEVDGTVVSIVTVIILGIGICLGVVLLIRWKLAL